MHYHLKTRRQRRAHRILFVEGRNKRLVVKFFDQPTGNDIKTYENIMKNATGQGDDYPSSCLLDYAYFQENYKMIVTDLSIQQSFDVVPKAF